MKPKFLVSALVAQLTLLLDYAVPCCAALSHNGVQQLPSTRDTQVDTSTSIYATRFDNVTWNNADWRLTTTTFDQGHYQSRMSVANGYVGINVAALGPFFEFDKIVDGDNVDEWPLFQRRQTFATIGGFFDSQTTLETNFPWLNQYGLDSVISGVPHWSGIVMDLGGDMFLDASTDNSTISNFVSMLDLKQGLMNWDFTWTPASNQSFNISYQMFAHKLHVNQGLVKMQVTALQDSNATIVNVLNGDCAVRSNFTEKGQTDGLIYTAVNPAGIANVTGYVFAGMTAAGGVHPLSASVIEDRPYIGNNESSIAEAFNVSLKAGKNAIFTKYVGLASSDGFSDAKSAASSAALAAFKTGYDASLKSHIEEWATIFPPESVDDFALDDGTLPDDAYIIESAITAVANPYYLLQNTIGANALEVATNNASINSHSISVGGLASESYGGQVFWDAEIWMQPGLAAAFPQSAQGIANYRVSRYGQALANAQTSYQSSKKDIKFSSNAAVFPWTSGRFGNCTGTGPCFDYEYHINGDIAQEFVNYWITSGDTEFFRNQLFPIYDSIATFYSEVMTKNGSSYQLLNMTDPDEYANHVDNGGFTMALISQTLTNANTFRSIFGLEPNNTFAAVAGDVMISRNEDVGITLEYTGMNGSVSVKQADVVLNTFPLGYNGNNYTQQDSLTDLDYYAAKQSDDGPGMTYAIFSIVANEVSPSGCSCYTYQQYSEKPYARAPWFQSSEQLIDDFATNGGTHPAYPFLTGNGGANQVVLFGYLGLRLVPDWYLHVDPALPPQIPQIRYRTFYWHGWPISAFSNFTHTTLTRPATHASIVTANATFANMPIPVLVGSNLVNAQETPFSLAPNSSITIPNRQYGSLKTVSGNMAQCLPVNSQDGFIPGQFPIGAVDGAASTKWQPSLANTSASITVTLSDEDVGQKKVKSFYFDWAQAPPVNFTVTFHNGSSPFDQNADPVTVAEISNVLISRPYNKTAAAEVVEYMSNTTFFNLSLTAEPVWLAKYATLSIIGNQALDDVLNGTGASVAEWAIIDADDHSNQDLSKTVTGERRRRHEDSMWMPSAEPVTTTTDAVTTEEGEAEGSGAVVQKDPVGVANEVIFRSRYERYLMARRGRLR